MLKNSYSNSLKYFLIFSLLVWSCNSDKDKKEDVSTETENELEFTVAPAPEWSAVFKRNSGWFGGDGIFAIPYSGDDNKTESDSILFLFSDTMFGEIENGELVPGYRMVHNSVGLFKKGQDLLNTDFFLSEDESGQKVSMFTPNTEGDEYYWLGDGFVNPKNDKLYIFAYRIRDTHDGSAFPFEEVGNDLLVIENKDQIPLETTSQLPIPHSYKELSGPPISFGAGVYTEGDDVYIYGVRGPNKELVVARTKAETIEDFSTWEFKAPDIWTKEHGLMENIAQQVSNELSVSKLENGQYALIYQGGGINPNIFMQLGDTPAGPFGEKQEIWNTSQEVDDPDLFTYNAKAHPAISGPGELLVSYNVNSFKFFEIIESKPNLYRPRFVKIKFNK
ncbi:hypothetical protein LZ575_17875 [Antarcticibacterium sp. 1MA-6-2]|uniref:hypothetical protein n=1 Tax=Antarcticibacterium sp. 1MA-6-2 TaxID=2908210 RepID=UPI001F3B2B75|nr:hypothetical protein [Antarcticibacterium sp. 1MA-6-2]UJH90626.1 hypothetical protein LZ575_17875 [Antarcticibacterium sp. 1MA-6-2]